MAPHLRMLYSACRLSLLFLLLSMAPRPVQSHAVNNLRSDDAAVAASARARLSLNAGWRFARFTTNPDSLSYETLKPWMLPSANNFISGSPYQRPSGATPGGTVSYAQASFDDSFWTSVDLPHDWAITGPFNAPGIPGEMGRLPSNGVGWYRRNVTLTADDIAAGRSIFLDIDGAMAYAAVWVNGYLVGGWPYGYNSFRLDLASTGHLVAGNNIIAIRLDNAFSSSRFYPGAGIYRNVWLIMVDATHVGQYGTYITTPTVSSASASLHLTVQVENQRTTGQQVNITTQVYEYDPVAQTAIGDVIATFPQTTASVMASTTTSFNSSVTIANPLLWGPALAQKPNLYVAITALSTTKVIDTYETPFGIRSVTFDPNNGVSVNGHAIRVQGTCNHHDQGSLGAAFNTRAAERQLLMLQDMGSNALRTSHNPPAPELLDIADRLGFMVLDEIFDCWNDDKRVNDFHLIFSDWHEPDLRNFMRRDRNHPSVIAWSLGNEIVEQSTAAGGATAEALKAIAREEDLRPVTSAMNTAGPSTLLAQTIDLEGLNYQGEGQGTSTEGTLSSFRKTYPNKMIWSTESASTISSRGIYLFPVASGNDASIGSKSGEDNLAKQISDYGLYTPGWGGSPDKVFVQQDRYPYVAGEFVWTGWDYLGEPTPYDSSRSSYFGIIDMAGFPKDRCFLYQSRWRPDFPNAHILPHWTWPERVGQVTPVHVFSSADSAELFVNGKSAGSLTATKSVYRFRWDQVVYEPGTLRVVTYKNGVQWAVDTKTTAGSAAKLNMTADRTAISVGVDLSYISIVILDSNGIPVPRTSNSITFSIASGPGTIVSTDNGDPTDMTVFQSLTRKAFGGLALAIVRATGAGTITVAAASSGLTGAQVILQAS